MSDSVTEISHESWGSRLMSSIKGVLIGVVLFLLAFPLLWWNEGNAVAQYKRLKKGNSDVIAVAADTVNPANNSKLIHLTGTLATDETPRDTALGIDAPGALRLVRSVEMYQWVEDSQKETKKNLGGSTDTVTTYSYSQKWTDKPIASAKFKEPRDHSNPADMPVKSDSFSVKKGTLGAFKVDSSVLGKVSGSEARPVLETELAALPANLRERASLRDGGIYIRSAMLAAPVAPAIPGTGNVAPSPTANTTTTPSPTAGVATTGSTNAPATAVATSSEPSIGDVRIRYTLTPTATISVVGAQTGDTLTTYTDKTGSTLLVEMGTHSANEMYATAAKKVGRSTWLFRLVGFIVMAIGIGMVFQPIAVFGDVIPFVGSLLGAGIGLFAGLTAFAFSLFTISLAWLFFRPLLGVPLLLLAVGGVVALVMAAKKHKAASPATS